LEERVETPETGQPEQGRVEGQIQATPQILEKARDYVLSSLNTFKGQRADWERRNEMKDRAYRAILEPPREASSSQKDTSYGRAYVGFDDKASPIIHDNVEAVKARLIESILPINRDIVAIDAPQMDPQLKDIREQQLNVQLEKNDIETKIKTVAHNAVVFGTFFISVPFLNSEKVVLTRQLVQKQVPILDSDGAPVLDELGQPIMDVEQAIEVIPEVDKKYFGPGYDPVKDIEDVYLDMFIENIQDQPIVVRRFIVDWDHLINGVDKGIYFQDKVDKIKDLSFGTDNLTDSSTRAEQILGTSDTGTFNQGSSGENKPREYEMLQAYCDFEIEDTDERGEKVIRSQKMVISVIGNEVVQFMPNPYFHQMIPLIKGTYRALPGEAYGMGSIDPVLDMYREYNDTMNQVNDSKILGLNPIKIVTSRSVSDKQDLDISPGVVWYEKNPGDIRFANFDLTPMQNGIQYLEVLEMKINRGMGVQRLMQGMGDQTDLDKTATGVTKVIEQADKKFRMVAKDIEFYAIKEWAEMAYKINKQFTPLPNGSSFNDINQEITFRIDGVDNFFNNLEETNKLITFTQQAASIPGINLVGLVLTIADRMGIEVDEKYGPLFQPVEPQKETKPMSLSTNISLDPSKGTWMALAAADLLNKKEGLQLNLDAIGEAATVISEQTPEKVKEESGVLPQESKRSVHKIKTSKDGEPTTTTTELNV
jgi:hypothetical protein